VSCGPGTHEENGVCMPDDTDATDDADSTDVADAADDADDTDVTDCGDTTNAADGGRGLPPAQQLYSPGGFISNGTELAQCEDGAWGVVGECDDPDQCKNGDEQTVDCGDNGSGTQAQVRSNTLSNTHHRPRYCRRHPVHYLGSCRVHIEQ
jgi:hypothetical protein